MEIEPASISPIPTHQVRVFKASDGYRLHYRHWTPAGTPRAVLVALHGIQSHSGWYEYSTRRLCQAGYEVLFLDRRGSGMNEPDRGHVVHYERWLHDVAQVLADIRGRESQTARKVPTVLMAVSWGGKVAAAVAARRPDLVDALALLYPGICPRLKARVDQKLRLRLGEALGVVRKTVPIPLSDPALFTAEPRWQEYIRNDPLALHDVTVGFLLANRDLDRWNASNPQSITLPTLLMLAGRDRIIDNPATRRYLTQTRANLQTIVEFPQAQHTLEFEPNRDDFIDRLLRWFDFTLDT